MKKLRIVSETLTSMHNRQNVHYYHLIGECQRKIAETHISLSYLTRINALETIITIEMTENKNVIILQMERLHCQRNAKT